MKRKLSQSWVTFLLLALLSGAPLLSHAQADYPNKPIRLIIGFPA